MLSGPDILAVATGVLHDLEALLLPVACLGCERALREADAGAVICGQCRLRQRRIAPPLCARCGQPRDRWDEPAEGQCGFCRDWPAALGTVRSAVWHEPLPARELAHALKYDGWTAAARPMAVAIAASHAALLRDADALVPVPLGRNRLRERSYNQAERLADALGAVLGVPVARDVLVRGRDTRSQTSLTPEERRRNVAGAFSAGAEMAGKRVMLVDDVLTTGATLAACAEALGAAGAAYVGAVTYARALVPN